jgi:hypothetical protein
VSRKRLIWISALGVVAIAVAAAAWSMRDDFAYARIATGYTAKQTCSCLHVSGRTLDSCIADFPADAQSSINVTAEADRVRTSVLFGAVSAEAAFEDSYGCRILD